MIELKGKTYHASVKNKKFQSPKLPKLKRGISLTVVEREAISGGIPTEKRLQYNKMRRHTSVSL